MSDREIYSHSGSLASLVSDLKNGQRGIDADSGDWLYKDYAGVIHAARSYKSYSGSVWNYNAIPTGLTGNRGLVTDSSGNLAASAVTSTELGYLSGVTSSIQTQLNGKLSGSGTTGRIPYFTSGSALGNSNLYFGGKSVRLMAAPSNWGTNFATIELGLNAIWANYGVQNGFGLTFSNNIYHDGTGNKPYVDGEALSYDQDGGIHTWYVDTGLIAGVAFTPTERMQLNTAGLKLSNINPSAALVSDANRVISSSSVTSTELGLLSGRTSLLGGSGTADYIPRFSNSGTLANSTIRYVDFGNSTRESLWIGGRSSVTFYKDSGAGGSLTWEHNIGRNSDGTTYARSSGTASCFSNTGDTFYWYYDTGLTGGETFTPTLRMSLGLAGFKISYLTADRVVYNNSVGYFQSSSVTSTELGYLSGVSSPIQTQLNWKIGGSGTSGRISYFTGSNTIGSSNLYSGNKSIRLMAAPSSWGANFAAVEIGLNAIWGSYTVQDGYGLSYSCNRYHDGTGNKPYVSGASCSYDQDGGIHTWYVDTGLIVGVDFTPTERMQLNTAGLKLSNINPSAALVSDANRVISSSSVTSTELGYLSGVSSAIQTQLNNKVTGSGTAGLIPYFTSSGTVGDTKCEYSPSTEQFLWYTTANSELMRLVDDYLWLNTKLVCNGISTGDTGYISMSTSTHTIDISAITQQNIKISSSANTTLYLYKARVGTLIYLTNIGSNQINVSYDKETSGPKHALYPGQTMQMLCINTYGAGSQSCTWAIWRTDTNPSSHLND
jgi:hypothetical protein